MRFYLVFLAISLGHFVLAQSWTQLTDFPGNPRDDGTGFKIGDSIYFGTGMTPWWSMEADFYGLTTQTDTWFSIASLPTTKERQYATGFSSNSGKGYVFGGFNNGQFLNDLWEYDPIINSWNEVTPLPSFGRSGSACFVINDTAYIIGGKNAVNSALDEVWAYSILSDTWVQKNNFPFGFRWRASATQLNETGFLILGRNENNEFQQGLYSFLPSSNLWVQTSIFPSIGRSHSSLYSLNQKLYACFGIDSLNYSHDDMWEYDFIQDTWSIATQLPALGRRGGIGVANENSFYYTTGIDENDQRMTETWKFNPIVSFPGLEYEKDDELIQILDVLGKETLVKPNVLLIYVYASGKIVKKIILE